MFTQVACIEAPQNNRRHLVYHKQRRFVKTKHEAKLKVSNNTGKINSSHLFTESNGHPFSQTFANFCILK